MTQITQILSLPWSGSTLFGATLHDPPNARFLGELGGPNPAGSRCGCGQDPCPFWDGPNGLRPCLKQHGHMTRLAEHLPETELIVSYKFCVVRVSGFRMGYWHLVTAPWRFLASEWRRHPQRPLREIAEWWVQGNVNIHNMLAAEGVGWSQTSYDTVVANACNAEWPPADCHPYGVNQTALHRPVELDESWRDMLTQSDLEALWNEPGVAAMARAYGYAKPTIK